MSKTEEERMEEQASVAMMALNTKDERTIMQAFTNYCMETIGSDSDKYAEVMIKHVKRLVRDLGLDEEAAQQEAHEAFLARFKGMLEREGFKEVGDDEYER